MLNATWLDTFTTLCETEHFTRAAERLNMTQPGVSQHLRKLEAQLGQSLIAREGKSFTLTAAGEAVFALGRARRNEEKHLRAALETDDRDAGEVRIACSGSFAMLLYPVLLPWMRAAPDLAIHLQAAPQAIFWRVCSTGVSILACSAPIPVMPDSRRAISDAKSCALCCRRMRPTGCPASPISTRVALSRIPTAMPMPTIF